MCGCKEERIEMKKIIALSLLSSLVGCAQLMPSKTPLQMPIETINTTKAMDAFVEPVVVAELDSSVKTDPLYQSSDSIAVSEQAITEPKPVINETVIAEPKVEVEATGTETKAIANTEANTEDEALESQTVEPSVVETEPVVNDTVITEPAVEAIEAEPVVNNTEITEPTSGAVSEVIPITEAVTVEHDTLQTVDDNYKTVDMHGYSLQITASRDEQSLVTLLSSLESQQPAWINRKMLNGSQAYTLLVGHYVDYDQAKAALALLPQTVQQNGAFVRNFYDIEHTGSPQLKQLQ